MCLGINPDQVFFGFSGLFRLDLKAEQTAFPPQEGHIVIIQQFRWNKAEVQQRLTFTRRSGCVLDLVNKRRDCQLFMLPLMT